MSTIQELAPRVFHVEAVRKFKFLGKTSSRLFITFTGITVPEKYRYWITAKNKMSSSEGANGSSNAANLIFPD